MSKVKSVKKPHIRYNAYYKVWVVSHSQTGYLKVAKDLETAFKLARNWWLYQYSRNSLPKRS